MCDTDYVGNTCRQLFQRIEEHKHSAIGKHLCDAYAHNQKNKDLYYFYYLVEVLNLRSAREFEQSRMIIVFVYLSRYEAENCE